MDLRSRRAHTLILSTVSYTHLDVYKRQPLHYIGKYYGDQSLLLIQTRNLSSRLFCSRLLYARITWSGKPFHHLALLTINLNIIIIFTHWYISLVYRVSSIVMVQQPPIILNISYLHRTCSLAWHLTLTSYIFDVSELGVITSFACATRTAFTSYRLRVVRRSTTTWYLLRGCSRNTRLFLGARASTGALFNSVTATHFLKYLIELLGMEKPISFDYNHRPLCNFDEVPSILYIPFSSLCNSVYFSILH